MNKIVVFDFDRTLIDYDTTLPFFLFCCHVNPLRFLLVPFYFCVKILSKFRLLSIRKEKEFGLQFFCPKKIDDFASLCAQFAKKITLNGIYFNEFIPLYKQEISIVVASASFQNYLEHIFPKAIVIGTLVKTDLTGKIIGIKQHPFREEKAALLKSLGMSEISCFYTDSENDLPTSKLASKTIWVKNGTIIKET